MTRPRSQLVSLDTTPYYHVVARCVRRWFLLSGDDKGHAVEHRKPWFLERLQTLGSVFAIDIAAYAVMSNHYHLVLRVNRETALGWSDEEVCRRWRVLFRGPLLVQRWITGAMMSEAEVASAKATVDQWRKRLYDLSWFMYCLNYFIALHANREDGARGRFWEGRFFSQALVDDVALLSCMAYVDLNPVRAGMAMNLEDSEFTSIQQRIQQVRAKMEGRETTDDDEKRPTLLQFSENNTANKPALLPFGLKAYMEFVDWAGRSQREGKRGIIKQKQPALLSAIGLSANQWRLLATELEKESTTTLDGLAKLEKLERRDAEKFAA